MSYAASTTLDGRVLWDFLVGEGLFTALTRQAAACLESLLRETVVEVQTSCVSAGGSLLLQFTVDAFERSDIVAVLSADEGLGGLFVPSAVTVSVTGCAARSFEDLRRQASGASRAGGLPRPPAARLPARTGRAAFAMVSR